MPISKKKLKQAKRLYPQKSLSEIAQELKADPKELAQALGIEAKELFPGSGFPRSRVSLFSLFLLAIISLLVYANSYRNTFHYDDFHSLTKNIHIRKLSNIPKFFRDPQTFSSKAGVKMVRPVLLTSFALNYAWSGYNAWSWLLVNIWLHLFNVLLVFIFLVHFTGKRKFAFIASLIFALHPVNTESVNYINCRSTLLCSTFIIFSLYGFIRGIINRKWFWLILGYLGFALGLLVKEEAIIVPALALVIDFLFIREKEKKKWLERALYYYLPFIFVIVIYFLYRQTVLEFLIQERKPRGLLTNLLTQSRSLVHYINLLLYPIHLNISYELYIYTHLIKDYVLFAILYLMALLGAGLYFWRRAPVFTFFVLNFFISLAPTTLIPLNAIMNEHRVYLPSLGFGILFSAILMKLHDLLPGKKKIILQSCFTIIIACYGVLVPLRNRVYVSDMALWRDTIRKSPTKAQVISDLGNAYFRQDTPNLDRAEQLYKWAIKWDANYFKAYHNLAIINYRRGMAVKETEPEKAEEYFRTAVGYFQSALKIFPYSSDSWNDMGTTYLHLKEYQQAEICYKRAIKLNPLDFRPYYNLGNLLEKQERYGEAEEYFKMTLRIYDRDVRHWYRVINIMIVQKKYREALQYTRKALELFPNDEILLKVYEQVSDVFGQRKKSHP